MLEKLFSTIQRSNRKTIEDVDGRPYSTVLLTPVPEPTPETFGLNTLAGIRDYIVANVDCLITSELMLHVVSPVRVDLVSKLVGSFEQRKTYLQANFGQALFQFDTYYGHEDFIIGMHSRFLETEDRQWVLKYVGGFSETASKDYEDDGVTQRTTVRRGLGSAKIDVEMVKNPCSLKPFRTFPDVDQPESDFLFRIRPSGEGVPPGCGLFEADGGAWKLVAIGNIAKWLGENVPDVAVIA